MRRHLHTPRTRLFRAALLLQALLACLALLLPALVSASGSDQLFPEPLDSQGRRLWRANVEWRTSNYYDPLGDLQGVKRRTLFSVLLKPGERLLLGSSALGVGAGDVRVYESGLVSGEIGQERFVEAGAFSCRAAQPGQGRISSREQELAGPTSDLRPVPGGFSPCIFTPAPGAAPGLYRIVFWGPAGGTSNAEVTPGGDIAPIRDRDLGVGLSQATLDQFTSVAAWHVSVQDAGSGVLLNGRLFSYYLAMLTNGNGRRTTITVYTVTRDGYRYKVDFRGDPYGFLYYANRFGFLYDPTPSQDNGDEQPLYRNVVAARTFPNGTLLSKQRQDQLELLQGDVRLAPPEFPLFFEEPDPETLTAIGFATEPIMPGLERFAFSGPAGDNTFNVAEGQSGMFTIRPLTPGSFTLVVSRDGQNFDPTNQRNAVFSTVVTQTGTVTFTWDGRDQAGTFFEVGRTYHARSSIKAGEIHVPALDVENNQQGTTLELINPPDIDRDGLRRSGLRRRQANSDEDCPPWEGGCFGAFYDDRGYETVDSQGLVTTVGVTNGPLCTSPDGTPLVYTAAPYSAGAFYGYPPEQMYAGPSGFDSRPNPQTGRTQRTWGFDPARADWPAGDTSPTNPGSVCEASGGFGDKKGLDLWTFYPAEISTTLRIVAPTVVKLTSFTALQQAQGLLLRWTTGLELETLGFHLYRSLEGRREGALRVTPRLIPAHGQSGGASYTWLDTTVEPGRRYTYWLAETELSGSKREYGPALTLRLASEQDWRLLLPLVLW
jgi:hypothetical protein